MGRTTIFVHFEEETMKSRLEKAIERLQNNDPTLTSLNFLGKEIGDAYAEALSIALASNTTLTSPDLVGNQIGDAGAEALSIALASNTTLTSLYLVGNRIGDAGAEALSVALASNTTLTSLYLFANGIGDAGAEALSVALASNTTLTSLYLGLDRIGDAGAEALSIALASNTTLTSLNLGLNRIGDAGAEALSVALTSNITLTSLELWSYQMDKKGEKSLKNINLLLNQNKILAYLLSKTANLNREKREFAENELTLLGFDLQALHLPENSLPQESVKRISSLLKALRGNSEKAPYTGLFFPWCYLNDLPFLRVFFKMDEVEDTVWMSKLGFCLPLFGNTFHVLDCPYVLTELDEEIQRVDREGYEPYLTLTEALAVGVKTLMNTLGFVPKLSLSYNGLSGEDFIDLLNYLSTNPPIEFLDLSHNPIMLKKWNRPKTQKMITRNSVFNHLRQLKGNTQLRYLDLSYTQITLDQRDYPKLLSIFNERRDLVIDLSANYVSCYMRGKENDDKEKTSKALCHFFQKLAPDDGALKHDPLNHFFEGLHFVRTPCVENSLFQAIGHCLNQDADELKEAFKAFVLERANTKQSDLDQEDWIEGYLKALASGKWHLPSTLTFVSHFLKVPLVVFSSDQTPVISRKWEHLSSNPLFLYWDGKQEYHALVYEEDFDAKDLLNRLISIIQNGVSVFYNKRRTQPKYLALHHGFWSESKPMDSVFSVLPRWEGLSLIDNTVRHVALCCLNSVTGGHGWLIIEGMYHFGQAFFLCADLTTNDNRTTQVNIHADFCPHRFKEGLLKGKILARVYPHQPKERIKALLNRIEEEHERSHYRYGSTGTSSLITSSQQVSAQLLSEEEQKAKTLNCMQWAIELLLEYEIIDQEEAKELSGNVMRYWPINIKESALCCVM